MQDTHQRPGTDGRKGPLDKEKGSTAMPRPTSLIIPVYNEERRVGAALDVLRRFVSEQPDVAEHLEVVFVDDGSTDATADRLLSLLVPRPPPTTVVLAKHGGKGAAIAKGVRFCGNEIIGFSDVDFSTPPEELERAWAAFEDGADAVFGSRGLDSSDITRRQPFSRELAGRSYNALLRFLGITDLRDTQCGFKLFRAPLARKVFSELSDGGFSFDLEVLVRLGREGALVRELPVRWAHDDDSRVRVLRDGLRMVLFALRLRLLPLPSASGPAPRFRRHDELAGVFVEE